MIDIVLGSGFGDEGKGNVTNYLCTSDSLVIRFNGGHQAGHNVHHNGLSHIFSSFGSGTLKGAKTFWSKYCTLYPKAFMNEYQSLWENFQAPTIYVDPMCPITTPFDVYKNQDIHLDSAHGTVGVGFGQTIWRHETLDHSYRIFAKDLQFPWILKEKLIQISLLYGRDPNTDEYVIEEFISQCQAVVHAIIIASEREVFEKFEHLVFEGAQGILLDREHGIFPHVTRSSTTSKNALEILNRNFGKKAISKKLNLYLVSRCYQTRHGNGPLLGENMDFVRNLDTSNETNKTSPWQGKFRYAPLSMEMIMYADKTEKTYSSEYKPTVTTVFTCTDQIKSEIPIIEVDGEINFFNAEKFKERFKTAIFSESPEM